MIKRQSTLSSLILLTALFCLLNTCVFFVSAVAAQDSSEWLADKTKLEDVMASEEINDEERCETVWNILWPWAKKGNYEARRWLTMLLLPMFHGNSITMPTGKENRLRDGVIMAAYSLSNTVSKNKEEGIAYSLDEAATSRALTFLIDESLKRAFPDKDPKYFRDEDFLKCIAYRGIFDEPIEQCVSSAVEGGLFPTFEEYASGIDEAIAEGKKAKCNFN